MTVVLAGVGPGLGVAIAEAFARGGHRVAGLARSAELGRRLEETLDGGYRHFTCDVTDAAGVGEAVAAIASDLGPPTVLVYDPMKLVIRPFAELAPEDFESVWRVTCFGAMMLARVTLPHMLAAGGGAMIFMGATASIKGSPRFASLASAKFALRGLAQSLARELGPQGVHVAHLVVDGLVWGPQSEARFGAKREACLEPAAIARAVLGLAGQDRSAWTHELDLRPYHEKF